jgi:hypothetical protein
MSETVNNRSRQPIIPQPETTAGKIGCGIALFFWFALLMLPCGMVWLASGGEVFIGQDVPDASEHPRFQLRLIADADNTGLQMTRSGVASQSDGELCLQTQVSYLLWNQDDDGDQGVIYCDCYERPSGESESPWTLTTTETGACS